MVVIALEGEGFDETGANIAITYKRVSVSALIQRAIQALANILASA
jgi:hypothetical protein